MRSRIVSAAATNQSRSVATEASLPRSSASLVRTALLIWSRSSSFVGVIAVRVKRCLSSVSSTFADPDRLPKVGLFIFVPLVPPSTLTELPRWSSPKARFVRTNDVVRSELHVQQRRAPLRVASSRRGFGEELNRNLQEARTALMIQELEIKR